MYKITKDLPYPEGYRGGGGRPPKYPFADLEIGDAFEVPIDKLKSIQSCASYYGTRHNKKFSVRSINGQYYCWRRA